MIRLLPRSMASRLFAVFFATALPLLAAAALLLERQARQALESELGRRVESLAVTVAASIPESSWQMVFSLGPGEEDSRTVRHLLSLLRAVRDGTGSEWLSVWTRDGRVVLDTDTRLLMGSPAPQAAFLHEELAAAADGRAASTRLFRSSTGRLVKIGIAPIAAESSTDDVRGVLIVQAPSRSLAVVARMRRTMVAVGLAALACVAAAALFVSRAATRRIRALATSAEQIGRGDLDSPVPGMGGDEIGVLADALEQMRAGVQVRDRQLRAMVGGVAHEIRNPLGGLTLFAEMLAQDAALTPEQTARAQRILTETSRLERVVAEFLAFARPETPRARSVALAPLIDETVQSASGAVAWKGSCTVRGDTAATVWSDPDHLRQILQNLVQNAMQAAPGGSVGIDVRAQSSGAELRVTDSGPGIAPAERERIFEPFYTTRAAGAGLGLAIVKRLCDLNRIALDVGESNELGGACFALRFHPQAGE